MNFQIILFYIFCAFFLFPSCQKKKLNLVEDVNIELNITNLQQLKLSQFTDNIKYTRFDNIENLPLFGISQIDISGNLILVTNSNICLLYDSEGHFISKIGTQGRGPGEYPFVINLGFGKNREIYLSFLYDLLEYDSKGSFLRKHSKCLLIDDKYIMRTWYPVDDSLLFGHIPNSTGQIEYRAILANKAGHVKRYYKNYDLFTREREIAGGFEKLTDIFDFNDSIFYKEFYNDTLFFLNDQFELVPKFAFNLGKYKEPQSERVKVPPSDMWKYIYIRNAFQTKNYLLLNCQFGYHFPAKRFTPFPPSPLGGLQLSWYNTTNMLGLFNKQTKELIFCEPTNTDNPLFTSGMFNDIDAGPRFFPIKQVNDSTMVMWVTAKGLKEHVVSDDFKNFLPIYPEKKKELEALANSLSEFDNPVLIFVTFKK